MEAVNGVVSGMKSPSPMCVVSVSSMEAVNGVVSGMKSPSPMFVCCFSEQHGGSEWCGQWHEVTQPYVCVLFH